MVIATRTACWAALLLGVPAAASAAPAPAPVRGPPLATPAHVLRPAEGFYDGGFSVDASGQHLTAIRTDGATFARIEILDLASGAVANSIDLGQSDQVPESVELMADGKSVLLIVRDPATDRLWASLVDPSGKPLAKTPMVTAFGRASIDSGKGASESTLVAVEARTAGPAKGAAANLAANLGLGSETAYNISAFRLSTLAPIGKPHSYRVGVGNQLKGTDISVVGFFDGWSRLLGQRAGGYDKKQDLRRPGRAVVLDTLTDKVASESEIEDVYAWTRTTKLRSGQPNRTAFAQLNGDQNGIEVLDGKGEKIAVPLAVPFRLYDQASLKDQEGPEKGRLYISLAVDPVNPDAIARQKTDTPVLDLYAVELDGGKARHRVRILLPRPVMWKAGYGKLVVLKRFKSFPRGGDELDVFDLP